MKKTVKPLYVKAVIIILFAAIIALYTSGPSFADGGETRKATLDEKKLLATVYSCLCDSLPKAPDGWMRDTETDRNFDEVGENFAKYPIKMSVAASYAKNENQAEGEAKEKAVAAITEKNKPAVDSLSKKQEELSEKIGKAAEKMDMKEVERLQKEAEKLNAEAEKLNASIISEMSASKGGDLFKSTSANASIELNPAEIYITSPSELPKFEGCFVLREKPENPDYDDKLKTVVLIGAWSVSKKSEGGLEIKSPYVESAPYDKIMCAAIHIDASKEITEAFLKTADIKKLSALIGK